VNWRKKTIKIHPSEKTRNMRTAKEQRKKGPRPGEIKLSVARGESVIDPILIKSEAFQKTSRPGHK